MIENISTLFGNSKLVSAITRRKKMDDIPTDSPTIEEAKAKVQQIIADGESKRKKNPKAKE